MDVFLDWFAWVIVGLAVAALAMAFIFAVAKEPAMMLVPAACLLVWAIVRVSR